MRSRSFRLRGLAKVAIAPALALLAAGCSGGSSSGGSPPNAGTGSSPAAPAVRLSITPGRGATDGKPDRGITVRAAGARITQVTVHTAGDPVTGKLNSAGTLWRSAWALNVSQRYTVTATAVGPSGAQVTRTSSFKTFTPKSTSTLTAKIVEGAHQTYGVGMPIILYLSRPVTNRAAVERALEVKTSRRVVGSWYWDTRCTLAPMCVYFRPRSYWRPHTRVSFTGHLDGVEVAPGVYGAHTLRQSFTIGRSLRTTVSTDTHSMTVYRDGKLFARWPISSGRPGDDTPDGTYLTIEKANPVEMKGPGYDISVPFSVRITWSGDYLHDAFWSVGQQGFSNVSHGCVNMSPAHAEIYYNMAVPGDPVEITGSPRPGTWGNGWTMWFLSWTQWLRGSAVHRQVVAGPQGSTFVRVRHHHKHHHRRHRSSAGSA